MVPQLVWRIEKRQRPGVLQDAAATAGRVCGHGNPCMSELGARVGAVCPVWFGLPDAVFGAKTGKSPVWLGLARFTDGGEG
jgi:hypothetical protein